MQKKFLGSTIALTLGILSILGAINLIAQGNADADPLAGTVTVLGAIAYKSLKKRKLGIVKSSIFRYVYELMLLAFLLALVLLQTNFKLRLMNDPIPNFIIPVWAFVAYGILSFKKTLQVD